MNQRTATPGVERGAREVTEHLAGSSGAGTVPPAQLARLLARLKLTLWRRSFRGNVGKIIGTAVGVLYGIGGLVLLASTLGGAALLLDGAGPGLFGLLVRGLGGLLVLTWTLLPFVAFGLDDTLDPRRFAALPRSARELQPGLLAAAALSLPTLFTVLGVLIASVCEVLWVLTASAAPIPWGIAAIVLMVPVNLLGVVLCVLLPRAVLAQASTRQGSRRGRELGGVIALVGGIGLLYAFSLVIQRVGESLDLELLGRIARAAAVVIAWTPFGALFSVPVDVAEGRPLVAAIRLLIGLAAIAAVWLWWRRSLRLSLRSALVGEASSGSAGTTPLVPRFVRADAAGAATGRSLRYWRRDSRYIAAIAVLPLMLIFFTAMGMLTPPMRPMALGMLLFVIGISSISVMNEIGFDGPAGWVNITAGLPARANLVGRVRALALITGPITILAGIAVPLLLGVGHLVPLILPAAIGIQLGGWGVAMLLGVLLPYPTAQPGTNPLRDKSASSANAMLAVFVGMVAIWVPQLPAIVLAAVGLVLGSTAIQIGAGLLSVVLGALALVLCLRGAARILERRYVDLFQKVRAFV